MSQKPTPPCRRAAIRRLTGYLSVLAVLFLTYAAPRASAQTACSVVYTISSQWSGGFGATIAINNTGTTAISNWTLTWSFANGQTVSELWNGVETQSGANVTVKNESYNGSIPAGGSYTGMGFNGTWNNVTNAIPTSFAINGVTCGGTTNVGSFTLKPSASTLSIAQGASGTDTISVTDVSPFTGSVTLAASGLPSGVTAAFGTNPTTGTSVITFAASSTAAAGTSTVTISGASGSLTASTTIALTITSTGTGGFTLKPSASTLSIAQGASGTDTITVTDVSPFAGSVTLAASGLPSGVTAAFGTNPAASTSVVTFTVSSTAAAGTSTITIKGTSGSLTASTTISLTVTAITAANATVTVNPASTGIAVTNQLLGMNMAVWNDATLADAVTPFETGGIKAVRWPGGSTADVYHWEGTSNNPSSPSLCPAGSFNFPSDTFADFVSELAVPAGLDIALTAAYGTNAACNGGGVPSEAAAWAANALTLGVTVSHMTVGNEVYGHWETDMHSVQWDPPTYAAAVGTSTSNGYYEQIKTASPKTLVGVAVDAGAPAVDDVTAGWDTTVLADSQFDFVEYHYYPQGPGGESDSFLVQQAAQGLTTNINIIKSELSSAGKAATPIYVGEMGSVSSNPGKQSWSITQGLFAGQVLGEMMNDGVSRATWWIGFGNCNGTAGNDSASLYGWQDFGAYNVFSDGSLDSTCPNAGSLGTPNPTAIAFQLFSQVLIDGEHVLTPSVTGDTTDVVAYAATNSGGEALVLFNRNENSSETVQVTVSGKTTSTAVTETTYDKAIYDESNPATTNTWAPPITTNLGAPALPLTLTLAPWSMNVVIIH